ncbi:DUF1192 domain-containing protein [Pleomorphomonas koreensis]|jgi:uncharacterized small protein (DUF1192 family)|uniref:DUF1192 domain-containing protein n=1 Tax=Pleomorphomonas koreensis TaxID=257440 RepID=UPI0003F77EC5|nr:DUF1192 domain-containing protein [Pleomorphomonas koreensis]
MIIDDDRPQPPAAHVVGQDLSHLSVADLRERVDLLRAEIARIEEALRLKDDVRNAADSLFKF